MDKIEYRAVIKFFVKEGFTPNEIHSKFIKVYGDSSRSFSTIKKWAVEFKRGRTSLEDESREGHPKSATTTESIKQVHDMVLDDRQMKVREIADHYRHFKRTCRIYFKRKIEYEKALHRWVARLLTADQKPTRMKFSEQCLERFNKNKINSYFWPNSPQWAKASSFNMFVDHTQRRTTVGRTQLDGRLDRRKELYQTTINTHNRQTSMLPVEFQPTIPAGERPPIHNLNSK
jgi:transposase